MWMDSYSDDVYVTPLIESKSRKIHVFGNNLTKELKVTFLKASSENKADEGFQINMKIYAPLLDKKNNVTNNRKPISFVSKSSTPLTEIKKISLAIMDEKNPLGNQF